MSGLVLVIGGTRGVGLLIVRRLIARGYRVRAMARNPADATREFGSAVEVVCGDLTKRQTLRPAITGVDHIILTAGVPSGRMAPETLVKATDYQGVLDTLGAAEAAGFKGRFVYLNSIGVTRPSIASRLLNLMKRNALVWRRLVEEDIRRSGIDYTIIRVGFLNDAAGGQRAVHVGQGALPLAPWNRIARTDVAEVFVEAMAHPQALRATFEIVWGKGERRDTLRALLAQLEPDSGRHTTGE